MVRLSALAGFLREDEGGQVCHSAMSAVFHRDPITADAIRLFFDIDIRAYPFMYESIRLDPTGQSIRNGPTALAFKEDLTEQGERPTMWEIMERNPVQRARFDSTMQALGTFPSHYLRHVLDAFNWSKIGTMVDVCSSFLAQYGAFPSPLK
jgi:6-hydroxytryprostatin B O-methyltransferase